MSNPVVPPLPGFFGRGEGRDENGQPDEVIEPLATEREEPLDPDLDEDRQNSAVADERAAREGVKEGDVSE